MASRATLAAVLGATLVVTGCFGAKDGSSTARTGAEGQAGQYFLVAVSGPPTGGIVSSGTDGKIHCGASTLGTPAADAGGVLQYAPAWYPGASACAPARYEWSQSVTLTATPVEPGFVFIGWAGDCSGIAPCTLPAGADRTVVAIFGKPGSGHGNFMDPGEHGPAFESQSYGGSPLACTSCHGPTLGGQGIAPSCATCHSWPLPWMVTYAIGGTVSGLSGEGLVVGTFGQPDLAVPAGAAAFAFETRVVEGTGYDVGIARQPANPAQICTVANGSGTVGAGDVTSVSVSCVDSFTVGGTIAGLSGSGLTLSWPGQPDAVVPAGATRFTFPDRVVAGTAFAVSIVRHPQGPAQTCAITGGSGVVGAADVTSAAISCGGTWAQVAAGGAHGVGIRPDGTLWAWGANTYGQLGLGAIGAAVPVPEQVGVEGDWAYVTAGDSHTVALKTDGTLWAWGMNDNGQLGLGVAGLPAASPVQVGTLAGWTAVSAGALHTLAVREDGTLWSWGNATYGQLGRGLPAVDVPAPVQVGLETTWASATAGAFHSLAIRTDGSLWGFGQNQTGQVGNGATGTLVPYPVRVGAATVWRSASAGLQHSVGVGVNGSLWTWGANANGQLGNGVIGGLPASVPSRVGLDVDWAGVATGIYHSVATRTDGSIWAWGYDFQGQVTGTPSGVPVVKPTRLGVGTGWARAVAGGYFSMATDSGGALWTWGSNAFGQVGDGTTAGAGVAP